MTEIKWITDYENENKYLTLRILNISDFENIEKFLTLKILKNFWLWKYKKKL